MIPVVASLILGSCAPPAILLTKADLQERSQKPSLRAAGKFAAAVGLPDLLTGGALLGILKSVADGILSHAADITNNLEQHLKEDVQAAITQLEQLAADDLKKPIEELAGTARLVADRAALIAFQGVALLRSLETCTAADAKVLAAALDATMTGVVTDGLFWSGERSFVTAGYALGSQSRMGIYVNRPPTTFKFSGYFQRYDPACGSPSVTLVGAGAGGGNLPLRVLTADERSIVVEIPTMRRADTYVVEFKIGKKKRLCNRCEAAVDKLTTQLVVMPEPAFAVNYNLQATCPVYSTVEKRATIDMGNNHCDGPTTATQQVCPAPGESLVSSQVFETNNAGCSHTGPMVQPGYCVRVDGTCPEKDKVLGIFCWGNNHFQIVTVVGTYRFATLTPANSPFQGTFAGAMGYEQSRSVIVVDPTSGSLPGGQPPSQCGWTVAASVTWPDGHKTDVPSRNGNGSLASAAPDGIGFQWNPADGSLNMATPPYQCEFLN